MPTHVSNNPSVSSSASPYISAHGHLVTGSGFLADHNVSIRITRAGEDISDYLTYLADGDGYLIASYRTAPRAPCTSPQPTTALMLTARAADCGATLAPSSWLTANQPTTIAPPCSYADCDWPPCADAPGFGPLTGPGTCCRHKVGI
jgi:hypothetical protein